MVKIILSDATDASHYADNISTYFGMRVMKSKKIAFNYKKCHVKSSFACP